MERKIEIIDMLSQTGVAKIEATSFVSPKAVPNLRDAEEVMAGIRRNPAITYAWATRPVSISIGCSTLRAAWGES